MNYRYTGVGSRATPSETLHLMTKIARRLAELNFVLRSGGAEGADKAFEAGAPPHRKEIYLIKDAINNTAAAKIAAAAHPAWKRCSLRTRLLHTRNVMQLLGKDLKTPSDFMICWTPNGAEDATKATGGTGQAIRIATMHNIPVYNLKNENRLEGIKEKLLDLGVL